MPAPTLSFGEQIIKGEKVISNLKYYWDLKSWTPAMGALLACGIKAPLGCNEIPNGGFGLDDQKAHVGSGVFNDAQRILNDWNDQDDPPLDVHPVDFFLWCDEDRIDTDWLRLFREIARCPIPEAVGLAHARVAMLFPPVHSTISMSGNRENDAETARLDSDGRVLTKATTEEDEIPAERLVRIETRCAELKSQGIRAFNKKLAEEEGVSKTRIKQLLNDAKKLRTKSMENSLGSQLSKIAGSSKRRG